MGLSFLIFSVSINNITELQAAAPPLTSRWRQRTRSCCASSYEIVAFKQATVCSHCWMPCSVWQLQMRQRGKQEQQSPADGGTYIHVSDTSPIHDKYEVLIREFLLRNSAWREQGVHSSTLCWKPPEECHLAACCALLLQKPLLLTTGEGVRVISLTWKSCVSRSHHEALQPSTDQRWARARKRRNKPGLHHMVCLGQTNSSLRVPGSFKSV